MPTRNREAIVAKWGLVLHHCTTVGDRRPAPSRPTEDIAHTRLYRLEDDRRASWLVWYETIGIFPLDTSLQWTSGADTSEAMSFTLRHDVGDTDISEVRWMYVVHTDVPDDVADEYNAWYDEEHLPRLVGVPGIARARRYVAVEGNPRYLTAYDLSQKDAFTSPEGLQARKTPRTTRMRELFSNTRRFTGTLLSSA